MAALFIFVVGSFALWLVIAFIRDISQTRQAIRRNYPVIVPLNKLHPDRSGNATNVSAA